MSAGEELLELAGQGDERAIKRAYARLLRSNRPDDDADAFQDLHACYQHALALCRSTADEGHHARVVPDAGQAGREASDIPRVVLADTAAPVLDPHGVALDIVQHAAVASASSLAVLLQERALSWSLRFRNDVGWALLDHLHREQPPLSEAHFSTLIQGFDWDDIALELDPLWLAAVERRCRQAWLLLPESRGTLRQRYEQCSDRYLSTQEMDDAVARLQDRRPRWRNRLEAIVPMRARDTPYLLAALEYWPAEDVPAGLDPTQVDFWARFGEPSHRVHLRYGALRSAIIGLFMGLVTAWGVNASPAVDAYRGGMIIAVATLLAPSSWLLLLGYRALLRWQCAHESDARGPAWLRWAFLPTAAAAVGTAMWVQRALGMDGLLLMSLDRAWVFGLALVAIKRARTRGPDPHSEANALPLFIGMIWPVAGIALSLVFWSMDLRRHLSDTRG